MQNCDTCEDYKQRIGQLEEHISNLENQLKQAQRMVGDSVNESMKTMATLGPFGIIPQVEVQMKVNIKTCMYQIAGPRPLTASFKSIFAVMPPVGAVSPLHIITLDAASRKRAQIPLCATHFCFVYPAFGTGDISAEKMPFIDMEDPRHNFIMFGGFAYCRVEGEDNTQVVQCNAIARGTDLRFGPYAKLPLRVHQILHLQDRWQPVTVDVIKQTGAQKFAWLSPGEFAEEGLPEPIEHGAFAYAFAAAQDHRYFPVVPNTDAPLSPEKLRPFQLMSERFTAGAKSDQGDQDSGCTICMEQSPNVVFLPCRHLTCCNDCAQRVAHCPQCNAPITEKLAIYR